MNTTPTTPHHAAPAPSPRTGDRPEASDPARRQEDSQRFRKLVGTRGKHDSGEGRDDESATGRRTSADSTRLLQRPVGRRGERDGEASSGTGGRHELLLRQRREHELSAGVFALQQAQAAVQHSTFQPTATTVASMAPALAELISRHVRQLLVPDAASRHAGSREIMITLKNDILPGTELWLSRTADGWNLRADTRSPEAYRMLVESAPDLIERFERGRLGRLQVDPTLSA